jgi:hypothetical protein
VAHNTLEGIRTTNFSQAFFILIWSQYNTPRQNFLKVPDIPNATKYNPHQKYTAWEPLYPRSPTEYVLFTLQRNYSQFLKFSGFKTKKKGQKQHSLDLSNLGCYAMSTDTLLPTICMSTVPLPSRMNSLNVGLFRPTDEGNMLLSHVSKYLPAEMTKHHRILASSTIL